VPDSITNSDTKNVEIIEDDVDVSQLETLEEQKLYCGKMLDGILYEENKLNNRLITVGSVNNTVQADDRIASSFGEYLGYNYGRMDASKGVFSSVLINLGNFIEGSLDTVDHGARGMYINLWYNLGLSSLNDFAECLIELEKIETDVIELAMKEGKDLLTLEAIH